MLRLLLSILVAFCVAPRAQAQLSGATNKLIGDAGVAGSTASAAEINPANAGFVDRTQIDSNGSLFSSSTLLVRYPGFETAETSTSGLSLPIGVPPGFIYKLNPRFGIGGFFVPGVGLGQDVAAKRIPVIILGTLNYLDIVGKGTLNGAGHLTAGYRVLPNLGVGLSFSTLSAAFAVEGKPSNGGATLVNVKGSISNMSMTFGVRFDPVPNKLALGFTTVLVNKSDLQTDISSPLIDSGLGGGGAGAKPPASGKPGKTSNGQLDPFKSIEGGFSFRITPRARVLADFAYSRANKEEKIFSLVDLREKKKDVHDTFSIKAGGIVGLTDNGNVMVGYHNEPAKIGQGAKGEGTLAGFGSIDLIMIMAGLEELKPYTQYAGGAQFGFMPQKEKKGKEVSYYYALTLSTGLVYRKASLGIDEKGELPGAYLSKKTTIPLGILYRF